MTTIPYLPVEFFHHGSVQDLATPPAAGVAAGGGMAGATLGGLDVATDGQAGADEQAGVVGHSQRSSAAARATRALAGTAGCVGRKSTPRCDISIPIATPTIKAADIWNLPADEVAAFVRKRPGIIFDDLSIKVGFAKQASIGS